MVYYLYESMKSATLPSELHDHIKVKVLSLTLLCYHFLSIADLTGLLLVQLASC